MRPGGRTDGLVHHSRVDGVERILVERILDSLGSVWSDGLDGRLANRVWKIVLASRRIHGPVPVRQPQRGGGGQVLVSLGARGELGCHHLRLLHEKLLERSVIVGKCRVLPRTEQDKGGAMAGRR
jgi:hypothetical protein